MGYDVEFAPEDLPDIPPPDLEASMVDVELPAGQTDLEQFVGSDEGEYVVYRQ